jgi:hypothetical protein
MTSSEGAANYALVGGISLAGSNEAVTTEDPEIRLR